MNNVRILMLVCAFTLASTICLAENTPGAPGGKKRPPKNPDIGQIDANADGKVSYEEIKAKFPGVTEERFKSRDKNGDGYITPEERLGEGPKAKPSAKPAAQTMQGREPGQIFKRADKDANGQVTLDELHAIAPRFPEDRFRELDKNNDGVITANEVPKPGQGGNEQAVAMLARRADVDRNGKVTYDEMVAVTPNLQRDRFDEMDRNKDGVLSPDDRAQAQRDGKQAQDEGVAKMLESDADQDGKITFEELTTVKSGFPRDAFDRVDRNKDEVISADDAKK